MLFFIVQAIPGCKSCF